MLYAIIIFILGPIVFVGYGQYCARRNRRIFFSANVNPNAERNVEERVAQNVKKNAEQRRYDVWE